MQNRQTKGTRCFVDADFSGDWNSDDPLNPENLISINGFVMMCSSMPFSGVETTDSNCTINLRG